MFWLILCSTLFVLGVLRILPDLACFRQLFCAIHILYQFCFQCSSRRFLKEFSVPANTMLGGKLFQLFITLLKKWKKMKKCAYWSVRTVFLRSWRVYSCSSRFIQLEQGTNSLVIIITVYNFKSFNHITSCSSVFQAW